MVLPAVTVQPPVTEHPEIQAVMTTPARTPETTITEIITIITIIITTPTITLQLLRTKTVQ